MLRPIAMPLVTFLILAILMFMTWDWLVLNIDIISAIATSFAFFATAWAAYEARKSAKSALQAVKTADETLHEARRNYQRDAFEKRYVLLLEQHNQQLQNVYAFLSSGTDDSKEFIKGVSENNQVGRACLYLNGHSIISPYMRTLYHLLKHVNEGFYFDNAIGDELIKKKKEYTSPLRSLIRNDVLYLIGLNCLVTKVRVDGVSVDNGYGYYQYLLNYFDFFEHAVFFDWRSNVRLDAADEHMKDYLSDRFISKLNIAISSCFSSGNYNDISFIGYPIEPPVYLAMNYVYKTAANKIMLDFFNGAVRNVDLLLQEHMESARGKKRNVFDKIGVVRGKYVGVNYNQTQMTTMVSSNKELLKMIFDYRKGRGLVVNKTVPAYFVDTPVRPAGNTFHGFFLLSGQMINWINDYIYYSKVIAFSRRDETDVFVKAFSDKAVEYISLNENRLKIYKSEFKGVGEI